MPPGIVSVLMNLGHCFRFHYARYLIFITKCHLRGISLEDDEEELDKHTIFNFFFFNFIVEDASHY